MTPQGRRRTIMAGAALTALLTLGGCTGSPDPSLAPSAAAPSATSSAEPTDVPSDVPVPPEKPAAMANDDEAGARAAADYFLALYGYTYQSDDFTLLEEFCHDDSTFCAGVRDQLAAQVEAGERYVGGTVAWTSEPVIEHKDEASMYVLTGEISQASFDVVGTDGVPLSSSPATTALNSVFVYFESGTWKGFDIGDETAGGQS